MNVSNLEAITYLNSELDLGSFSIKHDDLSTLKFYKDGVVPPTSAQIEQAKQKIIQERPLKLLRSVRNQILERTDKFTSISDWPQTPEQLQEWKNYRQTLRDLPQNSNPTDVNSISIPKPPIVTEDLEEFNQFWQ